MAKTNRLKILFVYDHEYPNLWRDGLWAALKILEKEFDITYHNLKTDQIYYGFDFDFVLGWGGFNSPVDKQMSNLDEIFWSLDYEKIKKGLCIGGNAFPYHPGYDVLFYETDWVKDYLKLEGNCVKAFGVNMDIYHEYEDRLKVFDYISVGAFASWKRHFLLRGKKGLRLAIGQIQRNNPEESMGIINGLLYDGIMVSDMVAPEQLADLYNASDICYISSDIMGGGERAILEARSCGTGVECENDNPKLKELCTGPIPSQRDYAEALKKGILSAL